MDSWVRWSASSLLAAGRQTEPRRTVRRRVTAGPVRARNLRDTDPRRDGVRSAGVVRRHTHHGDLDHLPGGRLLRDRHDHLDRGRRPDGELFGVTGEGPFEGRDRHAVVEKLKRTSRTNVLLRTRIMSVAFPSFWIVIAKLADRPRPTALVIVWW